MSTSQSQPEYPVVVSYFTGPPLYREYAKRLRRSCESLGLRYIIARVDDQGSWVRNVAMKPAFLLAAMQSSGSPVLWVDVDGVIVRLPELLRLPVEADFAIRAEPGQRQRKPIGRGLERIPANWPRQLKPQWFNTGTVFINDTESGRHFLRRWAKLASASPRAYQQLVCMQAWCDVSPATLWLPRGYCRIKKMHRRVQNKDIVVDHDLASLEHKAVRK